LSGRSEPVAVAVCLTVMPVARAIEGDAGFAMFMEVSAGAAASGAACTSVGDRSMRNYLHFLYYIYISISYQHNRLFNR
jgi:hypothetical protein